MTSRKAARSGRSAGEDRGETAAPLLVNRAQLARLLGVSTRQISYLETDGIIAPTRRGKGGRASQFDALEVVPAYINRLTAKDDDTLAPRDRKDLAQARLTELRLERERGALIERAVVVEAGREFVRRWCQRLDVLPRRLARAEAIPRECVPALEAAIRELRIDIATGWQVPDDETADPPTEAS